MKKTRNPKRLIFLAMVLVLTVVPVMPASAAPSFTPAVQDFFVRAILEFGEDPFEFNRYALHDFDGDQIPELLMGIANEQNPLFCTYAVLKYDAPGNRFLMIGSLAMSRYLMRDRYSNALIGFYQGRVDRGNRFTIYRNYYIANNSISRNTPLAFLENIGNDETFRTVYDGAEIGPGFFINDIEVGQARFEQEELSYRGSYDEVIVHDAFGFNQDVATIAVRTWRPVVINRRPIIFRDTDEFTRIWQMPMWELIRQKLGPADTNLDEWDLNQTIVKDNYQRYALFDIDGDRVPELFLAVQRGMKLSYDVYRFWNGGMQFIGSFDAYGKYLARMENGVFAFDPVPNDFYQQAAINVSFPNNSIRTDTLLQTYNRNSRFEYYAADRRGVNLLPVSHANYRNALLNFVAACPEIKTFDIQMVPPTAALIMYVRTGGFPLNQ